MNEHFPNKNTQFKPGESGNYRGRPKKWISTLKERGYKQCEVNDCIQVLLSMDEEELNEVNANEKATILERIVAAALLKSYSKKSLYDIETLLSRAQGKPKENIQAEVTVTKFDVKFNKEDDGNNISEV